MKSTVCLHFPGYVIKFQIPCEKKEEEGNEQIELSNYKLPLPLESYVKPPRPLVNTDLMEELSRDKPTGNFKEMCLKKIGLVRPKFSISRKKIIVVFAVEKNNNSLFFS